MDEARATSSRGGAHGKLDQDLLQVFIEAKIYGAAGVPEAAAEEVLRQRCLPPPLVIAHRGDSAHRPENTLAAFAGALELGVSAVEIDVQLTRDGRVVVMHDPTLDRTTSGRGDVRQLSLAEIRALSAGYPSRFGTAYQGERVPTLAEVLALLRDRARTLIEIKTESVTDDATGGVEALTIAEIRRAGRGRQGGAHLLRPARDPALRASWRRRSAAAASSAAPAPTSCSPTPAPRAPRSCCRTRAC